ncbi:MAG: PadR family transcriptional regulator [Candidatus Hodarchaeales archaeon]
MVSLKNKDGEKQEIQVQSISKLYTLLLLRTKKPVTGYRILKYLEKELETTASPTTLYNFLKELVKAGYIEEQADEKSKRAHGYELTPSGAKFVEKIVGRFGSLIDAAIQPKLTVCASCGVQLYDAFHIEEIDGRKMNFCCEHCAKAYKQHVSH